MSGSCVTPMAECCRGNRRDRGGCGFSIRRRLGIHCQDDTASAVANTVTAVAAGVTHVQCTANGYGERTGNADLLRWGEPQLKMGIECLPGKLAETRRIRTIAEIANIAPDTHQAMPASRPSPTRLVCTRQHSR